jgi:hypothetical protein
VVGCEVGIPLIAGGSTALATGSWGCLKLILPSG